MKIEFSKSESILTVALEGRLDTNTSPELENFLCENCCGINSLILDCDRLTYVSSAGLRVLLSTQKKMKNNLKLTNVSEVVMEVFEITGFIDILTIE